MASSSVSWCRGGQYEISDVVLGKGAYASVVEGSQEGRSLAIKKLEAPPDALQQLAFQIQLAEGMRKLPHPYVGIMVDWSPPENFPHYQVFPLGGPSVADHFFQDNSRRKGRWWDRQDVTVVVQCVGMYLWGHSSLLAAGLAYLHSLSIIHRDIKPGNSMLCFCHSESYSTLGLHHNDWEWQGTCSSSIGSDHRFWHGNFTRLRWQYLAPGNIVCIVPSLCVDPYRHYMAPEVDDFSYNEKCDIYSLGVSWKAFELLSEEWKPEHDLLPYLPGQVSLAKQDSMQSTHPDSYQLVKSFSALLNAHTKKILADNRKAEREGAQVSPRLSCVSPFLRHFFIGVGTSDTQRTNRAPFSSRVCTPPSRGTTPQSPYKKNCRWPEFRVHSLEALPGVVVWIWEYKPYLRQLNSLAISKKFVVYKKDKKHNIEILCYTGVLDVSPLLNRLEVFSHQIRNTSSRGYFRSGSSHQCPAIGAPNLQIYPQCALLAWNPVGGHETHETT